MSQKGFSPILIVILIAVTALAGGFWVYQSNPSNPPNPSSTPKVACTQEAKLCPDGSSVGRVGPKCDFTPCPTPESTSSADISNWKTYKSDFYTFKYPPNWKEIDNYGTGGSFIIEPVETENVWIGFSLSTKISNSDAPEEYANSLSTIYTVTNRKEILVDKHKAIYSEIEGAEGRDKGTTTYVLIGDVKSITNFHPADGGPRLTVGTLEVIMTNRDNVNPELYRKLLDQILSTFKFLDQDVSDQSDGNCQPRPACLDAITTPRCLMPEPAEGWCP